jgi:crotonobetainyl-CoA:carnitine CoA-transferase CaiB-like acyl-CoA transferase
MLPLEAIMVVALEQAVAAPFATRQLAGLGARVIKVERPGTGDFARDYDSSARGQSSYFVWLNRGQESVLPPVSVPGREPAMGPIPALGQHTAAVLAELGLTATAPASAKAGRDG